MSPRRESLSAALEQFRVAVRPPDPEAWDFEKPSRAVVACDGQGTGVILSWVGGDLSIEIEECGLTALEELGLDKAPFGLSVWEGRYVDAPGSYGPEDGPEPEARGTFRDLDDDEAAAVLERRHPWDPDAWKMKARQAP